jgi:aryl carrier-like protein
MSLREKIEDILQLKLEDLPDDKKIVELGIDSMKLAQMVKTIDTFTGKRIKYREAIVMTVEEVKGIIEGCKGE